MENNSEIYKSIKYLGSCLCLGMIFLAVGITESGVGKYYMTIAAFMAGLIVAYPILKEVGIDLDYVTKSKKENQIDTHYNYVGG
ncbi:hypothetical protein [Ferrimonas pelagia]|uniref:Uncharacterized protein n=1 Tax=Ferrimonas pelagia TaxID=1177826 RepID=A0ABP9ERP5_9GAMM